MQVRPTLTRASETKNKQKSASTSIIAEAGAEIKEEIMKKLQNPSYRIPQWALDAACNGLDELALRLEIEASIYQQMNTHEGRLLADERVEQAETYRNAAAFFQRL